MTHASFHRRRSARHIWLLPMVAACALALPAVSQSKSAERRAESASAESENAKQLKRHIAELAERISDPGLSARRRIEISEELAAVSQELARIAHREARTSAGQVAERSSRSAERAQAGQRGQEREERARKLAERENSRAEQRMIQQMERHTAQMEREVQQAERRMEQLREEYERRREDMQRSLRDRQRAMEDRMRQFQDQMRQNQDRLRQQLEERGPAREVEPPEEVSEEVMLLEEAEPAEPGAKPRPARVLKERKKVQERQRKRRVKRDRGDSSSQLSALLESAQHLASTSTEDALDSVSEALELLADSGVHNLAELESGLAEALESAAEEVEEHLEELDLEAILGEVQEEIEAAVGELDLSGVVQINGVDHALRDLESHLADIDLDGIQSRVQDALEALDIDIDVDVNVDGLDGQDHRIRIVVPKPESAEVREGLFMREAKPSKSKPSKSKSKSKAKSSGNSHNPLMRTTEVVIESTNRCGEAASSCSSNASTESCAGDEVEEVGASMEIAVSVGGGSAGDDEVSCCDERDACDEDTPETGSECCDEPCCDEPCCDEPCCDEPCDEAVPGDVESAPAPGDKPTSRPRSLIVRSPASAAPPQDAPSSIQQLLPGIAAHPPAVRTAPGTKRRLAPSSPPGALVNPLSSPAPRAAVPAPPARPAKIAPVSIRPLPSALEPHAVQREIVETAEALRDEIRRVDGLLTEIEGQQAAGVSTPK